jgi:predicted metalloprotease with PDZ domain
MSALDACEPQIIHALEKDGWQIVEKPHQIKVDRRIVFADFSARHTNEDGDHYIIVMEVKCFANPKTDLTELYTAIGQYQLYRTALLKNDENYPLYLAIPHNAYERFVDNPTLLATFQVTEVKLVVVDIVQEVVVQWHP